MFEYWQSVPEPERSAWFIAYVYRQYPFCDVMQPFSKEELLAFNSAKGKKRIPFKGKMLERPDSNCGTLAQPLDAETWEQQIYERWGAGDYQIRLNDQHESIHGTVTECHIRNLRDWDKYPPVLALNTVVLTDENNAPYLRWARLKGIKFPGDPDEQPHAAATEQGEDDMATAATVAQDAMKHAEKMTERVIEMAKERPAAAPASSDANGKGQLAAIDTVAEGAKQTIAMMGGAMKTMLENSLQQNNPREQLKETVAIIKEIIPQQSSNGNSDLLKMMEMQLTASREQARVQLDQQEKNFTRLIDMQRESNAATVRVLEQRIQSLETQKAEPSASKEEDALKTYARIRGLVREIQEEDEPATEGPAWLGPALQFGEKVIGGISDSMKSLAAMRAGQAPPPTITEITPQPVPAPQAAPPDPAAETLRQNAMMIHRPLVDAIKAAQPGYDFGAAVIREAGQGAYDFVTKDGYNGVVRLLQSHPPLWQELLLPPIGAATLDKFVAEFLDRNKVMEAIQMMSGQPVRRGPKVNQ